MKNVVIVGASGHGGMVLDCIKREPQRKSRILGTPAVEDLEITE